MIFYYSACGNSRSIARELAAGLGERLCYIPDLLRQEPIRYDIAPDESIGFVFPVYSWGPPRIVEQFVQRCGWHGMAGYTWFACTCGDDMGHTRRLFAATLKGVGMRLDACFCMIMPETYLALPGFSLDTKQGARRKIAAAKEKLPWVVRQIGGRQTVWDETRGVLPVVKSYLIRPIFVRVASDRKYHVLDGCNGCGTCARVCPVSNIVMSAGHPQWKGGCIECMACYHHCPRNVVQYGRYTRGKGQYFFGKKRLCENDADVAAKDADGSAAEDLGQRVVVDEHAAAHDGAREENSGTQRP